MNVTGKKQRFAEGGMTLVELLVAMVVGLFLIAGVIAVMLDSKDAFLSEQELAFIQENGRFAVDEIGYDVRMAGYTGCNAAATLANTIDVSGADNWMFDVPGIIGFDSISDGVAKSEFPAEFRDDVIDDSDILIITRGETIESIAVKEHDPSAAVIHFSGDGERPANGKIMMISSSDCRHSAMFQVTGANNEQPGQFGHARGNSQSPGNCSKALSNATGGGYDCAAAPPQNVEGITFAPGSAILEYKANAYYLGTSSVTGLSALFRESLVVSGGNAVTQAQELVSGVESMSILYGIDTSADSPDGTVDQYYVADDISAKVADLSSGWVGWDRVTTVRLNLILRSAREVFAKNTAVDLGDGFTFNDRFMRQRINSTIRVRNRGLGG